MITIIDYKAGNVGSLKNAIESLGFSCQITSDPQKIGRAEKIIFPGQGRAGSAMKELRKRGIDKIIKKIKAPFLGICLGMQLLADYSVEDKTRGLAIIPGDVFKFGNGLRVPQIGWNSVRIKNNPPLFRGINNNEYFYFIHSYYFAAPEQYVVGRTDYGIGFVSALQKDNYYAVQFHPEKSGEAGLKLLRNFCLL